MSQARNAIRPARAYTREPSPRQFVAPQLCSVHNLGPDCVQSRTPNLLCDLVCNLRRSAHSCCVTHCVAYYIEPTARQGARACTTTRRDGMAFAC